MGRFGPAFLDQDDHGLGTQDDLFSEGFAQDDHGWGAQMICFPRVFPKMIMVGVVGVRENASWPRILLSLPQDDHSALSLRERSACMSHFRKDASESRAFSRGARGLRACLGEATSSEDFR